MKAGFLAWDKSHDADQILLDIEAQFEEHIYGQICLFVCLFSQNGSFVPYRFIGGVRWQILFQPGLLPWVKWEYVLFIVACVFPFDAHIRLFWFQK